MAVMVFVSARNLTALGIIIRFAMSMCAIDDMRRDEAVDES